MAFNILSSLIFAGSRVKSGFSMYGVGLSITKSTQSAGISTRDTLSTSLFTCTMTIPWLNFVASAIAGVSSVEQPE